MPILALLLLCAITTLPAAAATPTPVDPLAVSRALNEILETAKTGSRTRWQGREGRFGYVTIKRTWFPQSDTPCRQYSRSLTRPGQTTATVLRGTGCRDGNGNWLLLETTGPGATTKSTSNAKPPASARRATASTRGASKPKSGSKARTTTKPLTKPATPAKPATPRSSASSKPASVTASGAAATAIERASQPTAADW